MAVALSSLPWLGAAGGWLLDKVFDTFPLLLVMGGLAGVCLGLVCAYLATGTALSGGRLDPGHRPGSHSYPRREHARTLADVDLVGEFVDRASADDLRGRRAWRQLLEAALKRDVDLIVVWRLDRAFRSVVDGATTLQTLRSA